MQGDRKRCHRTHASLVAIKDRVAVPEARVDDVSNLNLNPYRNLLLMGSRGIFMDSFPSRNGMARIQTASLLTRGCFCGLCRCHPEHSPPNQRKIKTVIAN